jgi:hypothetical protein
MDARRRSIDYERKVPKPVYCLIDETDQAFAAYR